MAEAGQGCVTPVKGPIKSAPSPTAIEFQKEEPSMYLPLVGHEAPDFEANVFVNGGFQSMKLSDHKGKWIVLCFYPGDFTFV